MKVQNMHGFEFLRKVEIPEISAILHEAVYTKNGAKLIFLERDDDNKSFAISFKTIPDDDTGVFHILEHSVLCGSEKYPVKEPFVELLKGSLNTFLNAMTFPDKTVYPVSSRNDKDFLNLVDVYMDAVLHPTAIKNPDIFYQEGWHHELFSKDEQMSYKGVVFNEMKGAYSSADEVGMEYMSKLLYPGLCYSKDSGGDPEVIPTLTYEKFVESHKKFYHPSNSRIFLDGKVDLDKTLSLLDSFLKDYDYLDVDIKIPDVEPIGHTEKTIEYEISSAEDERNKTRLGLGFLAASFDERKKLLALNLISDAIASTNESVLKKAILDSGLCEDVSFISYDGVKQNSLIVDFKNVKDGKCEQITELFYETVKKIVADGIDRTTLTASLNIAEFKAREQDQGTLPSGIAYAVCIHETWLYDGVPELSLCFDSDIKELRAALDTDYYERLLEDVILNSPHKATLIMTPSKTLGEERAAREQARLNASLRAMTDDEIQATIDRTLALNEWQKTPDSEEALKTLPTLSISDISKEPEKYPTDISDADGTDILFTEVKSKGITYASLLFDISDLNEDELFLASVACKLFTNVKAGEAEAIAVQNEIKANLGSFDISLLCATKNGVATPYMRVHTSLLDSKKCEAKQIIEKVTMASDFSDAEVIRRIIKQTKTAAQEMINNAGHIVAVNRAAAYVGKEAAINEYTDGIEFYKKLKDLDDNIDSKLDGFIKDVTELVGKIFKRERLFIAYWGRRDKDFEKSLANLFERGDSTLGECKIKPLGIKREGFAIPAQIGYAANASDASKISNEGIFGAFGVIRSVLSYGYLWNEIRVQGGAYGAGFLSRQNGTLAFYSYRDPNPARTLDAYKKSADFLRTIADSGQDITNFIIGAVGESDILITPKVLGSLALSSYLRGDSYEKRKARRARMLSVNSSDLKEAADILEKYMANDAYCVVGGKDKLIACGDKLESIIEI